MDEIEKNVVPELAILGRAVLDVGPRRIGEHALFTVDFPVFQPVEIAGVGGQEPVNKLSLVRFEV
jgi:hypothetical protein